MQCAQALLQLARQAVQAVKDEKAALEAQLQTKQKRLDDQHADHAAAHQAFVQRTDQVLPAASMPEQCQVRICIGGAAAVVCGNVVQG